MVRQLTREGTWGENGYLAERGVVPLPREQRDAYAKKVKELNEPAETERPQTSVDASKFMPDLDRLRQLLEDADAEPADLAEGLFASSARERAGGLPSVRNIFRRMPACRETGPTVVTPKPSPIPDYP